MSVKSSPFGSVVLSGEDAKAFANQVRYGRPKKAAVEAVERGSRAAKEFHETGSMKFELVGGKLEKTSINSNPLPRAGLKR